MVRIQILHKISECVLENMQLSYGGDRYKAYEGGVPVVTNMTLTSRNWILSQEQMY